MYKVRIDGVENSVQPAVVMRQLTEPLGATDVVINYYELEPGGSLAFTYYRHEVQKELFYIQSGTATFETESGEIDADAAGVVRFPPGEFQRGWNWGDDKVVVLALGASLEYGEQIKLRECPGCAESTDHALERRPDSDAADEELVVAICRECGLETGEWTEGSIPDRAVNLRHCRCRG